MEKYIKPLKNKDIYGNWATLLLPITKNESIDYGLLVEEIDSLTRASVNGIYSNGTAGEFYSQTEDEFDRVSVLLAEKCHAAKIPFQLGACHMSPTISLERVMRARQLDPSAIQVILPDWWVPSDSEMLSFLEQICAEAVPIGVVLYNPPHAKKRLMPEDFARIKQAGIPLVGCKVAGGDKHWYATMRKYMTHLSVFIPGHMLATGLRNGAQGAYSNVACINPRAAQLWYESMHRDMEGALALEYRIQKFIQQCIQPYLKQGYSNQAVDKFLAAVGGWMDIGTRIRWPYESIPEEDVERIQARAQDIIPEFFNIET